MKKWLLCLMALCFLLGCMQSPDVMSETPKETVLLTVAPTEAPCPTGAPVLVPVAHNAPHIEK